MIHNTKTALALPQRIDDPAARDEYHRLNLEIHEIGKSAGLEIGRRLRRIHDAQLWWVGGYSGFREYAATEHGDTRGHSYRLIRYAETIDKALAWIDKDRNVDHLIPTERAVRELVRVHKEHAIEILRTVFDTGRPLADLRSDADLLALAAPVADEPRLLDGECLPLGDTDDQAKVTIPSPKARTKASAKLPTRDEARAACERIVSALEHDYRTADPSVLSGVPSAKWRHDMLDRLQPLALHLHKIVDSLRDSR